MYVKPTNRLVALIDKKYLLAWRVLFRIKKKITGNTRPGSYPYVSGDSFRILADYIHDETGTFEPSEVKRGDIVFVSNPLIFSYLQTIHPEIKTPYILIEHNGDNSIDKSVVDLLDEKIIRFYAQDVVYAHEKIIPIPIGLENLHYHVNGVTSLFNRFRRRIEKHPTLRKNRIFFFFSVNTNPSERGPAKEYFLKHQLMDTAIGMLSPRLHLRTLMSYKFVASPPGHAIESSRTWEALYLKTVPIVKDFVSMEFFASIGLPIWVVHNWKELEGYSEQALSTKYEQFIEKANWEPLYMDFWIKKINADQKMVRASS
jgi:hypothetical protein